MRLHRQGLAVALAMRVVCGLAWAQEIEFHASFEEAQAAAREHQQFIMVVVTAPEAPHHKRMTEEILTSGPIVELVRQYFAPVMINLEDVRAGKTKLPAPIKAKYTKGNQIHMPIPAAVFYDREGKQIEKLAEFIIDQKGTKKWFDLLPGGLQPEAFHSVLKTISAKVAEAVPPKERRDVARALQQGQAAFEPALARLAGVGRPSADGAGPRAGVGGGYGPSGFVLHVVRSQKYFFSFLLSMALARHIRLLTVPEGSPRRRAISSQDSPSM